MAGERFEELKRAISAYGEAAFQNLLRSRALGEAIVKGFPAYIGCDEKCVSVVPPEGPFDPNKDYGDEAYSYHGRPVIVLEPVRFGVSVVVGNAEDSGSLWLRTAVSAEVAGDAFEVFVGSQPMLRTPLEFEGKLEPVFEAVYQEFLATFQLEVMEFNDSRFKEGIGFLPG
ncbi:MAG: hypothetical protein RIA10_14985 [Amphiplicatus sp.]